MSKENILYKTFPNLMQNFMNSDYQEAVNCVNSLQSNAAYIQSASSKGILPHSSIYSSTIAETQKYLLRTGITLETLDKLSVIHVAGTKGKGSTCAFVESILRQYKYKTGFYSSPHLIAMRERIRIDGKSLDKDIFAQNVIKIYKLLLDKRDHPDDMPAYFRFLTIVAFNVFLAENVDVAIIEVGVGGEYDCTNIVRNTPIVGITSLGIDHEKLLGNTIEKIAWQKAGIMKQNSKVFTVEQPEAAMEVLRERSKERMCELYIVPKYKNYWHGPEPKLSLNGIVQKINASLAIQLAHNWMQICGKGRVTELSGDPYQIGASTLNGLLSCKWPGRNQILKIERNNFYLDGAHTIESIESCADWFKTVTKESTNKYKALIFNVTHNRESKTFLEILIKINFDYVIFSPNVASNVSVADQKNLQVTEDQQIKWCENHKDMWIELQKNNYISTDVQRVDVFSNVAAGLSDLPPDRGIDVLVTGSLHLVGAILTLLDPNLEC